MIWIEEFACYLILINFENRSNYFSVFQFVLFFSFEKETNGIGFQRWKILIWSIE